jgi:hypothetical protein
LQAAISASNLSTSTGEEKSLYIPTPDASRKIENYRDFYSRPFTEPSTLIRFSSTVEDCIGCPYNMDSEDEEWLKEFNEKRAAGEEKLDDDHFELIMWQFEKITNERVPYLQLVRTQLTHPLALGCPWMLTMSIHILWTSFHPHRIVARYLHLKT